MAYKKYDELPGVDAPPKKNEDKDKTIVQYVMERFEYLHGLKSPRFPKYWQYQKEYSQLQEIQSTEDGIMQYRMNTGFALVNAKVAEIINSTPKFDFVGLDENGRKYKKMVEKAWDWMWNKSGTDKAILTIIRDSCKYGTGFGKEIWSKEYRTIREPDFDSDGMVQFQEKEILEYDGSRLIPLDWGNVYVNGASMEECTEAIVVTHWDKDEFFQRHKPGRFYNYKQDEIKLGRNYSVNRSDNTLIMNYQTDRTKDKSDDENTISVIEYWNKYKDEYIVIASDVHINPYNDGIMPLPYPHKEIPIVMNTDHIVDNDIYGRGEFDITEKSRLIKDETRSLLIESIKIQGGIITIDPMSEFDESVEKIGLKQVARVKKEDFGFFSPTINVTALEILEKKIDEDIIVETGVDFRGQLFGPGETAERQKGRVETARKRINSNIKENGYSFYSRLAKLRISNMSVYMKSLVDPIPVKGMSISKDGVQEALSGEYGIMQVTENMFSGKILLIPIVDSLVGNTTKELRQKWLEFFQIAVNLKNADGTPVFDPSALIETGRGLIDDAVDLDKLIGPNSSIEKELKKILKERGLPTPDGEASTPPGGIPPAQQSGRALILPSAPKYEEDM